MPITGVSQVQAALDAWLQKKHEEVNTAIETGVNSTYDGSDQIVPVRTGQLKASGGKETKDLHGEVTYTAPYAIFVEVGTHKMRPHPYLVPPFLKAAQAFRQECEQIVQR